MIKYKQVNFKGDNFMKKTNLSTVLCGLIIVTVAVLLDQLSKIGMIAWLSDLPNKTFVVIPGFFEFHLTFNNGAAFSIFSGNFPLLMGFTVIATIIFFIMALKADFEDAPWYSWGIYLMIGGMIGNFIDRVWAPNHEVTDFVSLIFGDYYFGIFNLADSFLVIGVILVCIDLLFFEGRRKKKIEGECDE